MEMRTADRHPYLERQRGLTTEVLGSERFAGAIRIDARGNAVFPHFDQDGLCGFELRNDGFQGFASGGTKGLWSSGVLQTDDKLVLFEAAIDALSYALLFPDTATRYASIGGKPNPVQPELIRAAAARMPVGSEVIAAMDADEDGRTLAQVVRRAVELTGRADLRFSSREPSNCKDWNDQLLAQVNAPKPRSYGGPSIA